MMLLYRTVKKHHYLRTENMFLDEAIRQAQAAVEQKFLFRKIGLPFDYASTADDFPSKAFATAKEARSNLPNPAGLGSGFHFSCRNHALLFDAYLLRVESGIEGAGDEAILDRLIGGLIRLATVAPKSFLVGGLAPDGRGFYALPRRENHAAWAFAAMRGLTTAAIAPESQEKFRSITGKWMDRIKRDKFRLSSIDGKPAPAGDLSQPEADNGPFLLAMLLVAAKASGEERDLQFYAQTAEENERARLGEFTPESGWTGDTLVDLLWRQAAWSVIRDLDPDAARQEIARGRMRALALAAAQHAAAWRAWDREPAALAPDFDWRKKPKVPLEESPYGFALPDAWRRIDNEKHVEHTITAALILLLPGDAALAEPFAEEIGACLRDIPWQDMLTLTALAPAVCVHARGVELNLWDKELYDSRRETPSADVSFAAKYLEPDYDERNPAKAGHLSPPPGSSGAAAPSSAQRKRRRRKKK
jgi:hypothetical protein